MFNDFSYPLYLCNVPVPYSSLDRIRIVKTVEYPIIFLYGNETPSELVEVTIKESGLAGKIFFTKILISPFPFLPFSPLKIS